RSGRLSRARLAGRPARRAITPACGLSVRGQETMLPMDGTPAVRTACLDVRRPREQRARRLVCTRVLARDLLDEPAHQVADADHPDEEVALADGQVADALRGHEGRGVEDVVL